jgi:hypothetical protein
MIRNSAALAKRYEPGSEDSFWSPPECVNLIWTCYRLINMRFGYNLLYSKLES